MAHDIDPSLVSAAQSDVVRPTVLLKLDFDSGTVALHSSVGDIEHDGVTYLGVGSFGSISDVTEEGGVSPSGITVTLSGIPSDLISLFLGESYQGRSATVFFALLDENHQVISTPTVIFRGLTDTATISAGDKSQITLSIESRLALWNRPKVRRYTDADQRVEFPLDEGLSFVAELADKEIEWGR